MTGSAKQSRGNMAKRADPCPDPTDRFLKKEEKHQWKFAMHPANFGV
jgi:hypothetical protein